jgi:hypothetical protein
MQDRLPLFGTDYHTKALFHALLVNNDMPGGRAFDSKNVHVRKKRGEKASDARDIIRCRDEPRILIWFVLREEIRYVVRKGK